MDAAADDRVRPAIRALALLIVPFLLAAFVIPVALFASLLGVTTVLHWDRFTHGHVSFAAWAALYFAAPVLVVAVAVQNSRAARGAVLGPEPRRPAAVRIVLGGTGLAELVVAAALFVPPGPVGGQGARDRKSGGEGKSV
ncbi:hypothetical protein ACWEF6_39975, partial [Amycolatopsis sp. NPDC004772]